MSTMEDNSNSNNNNQSIKNIKNDTNIFSDLIISVRDIRDNANRFLESLEKFDIIRREINVGSLNNFIQGVLNTDYNEVEEVVAVDTSSTGRQSTTPTTGTSPVFVSLRNLPLADSFSESSTTSEKTPPVILSTSPYTQIETPPDVTSTSPLIITESQSDSSTQYSQVVIGGDRSTIADSTTSFKKPRRHPRKFSNRYTAIIDQAVPSKSDRKTSQKNVSSRITEKSISASELCCSNTTSDSSARSGSVVYSDEDLNTSSSDDSRFEKVMNLVRAYISTTKSDALKDGIYTWKNTRPIFINEHLVKVKKLFRNNNIPSSTNEDDDIVSAFKRIHTSRRSMHLTRQKCVHTNSSPSRRPNSSNKGKQCMR